MSRLIEMGQAAKEASVVLAKLRTRKKIKLLLLRQRHLSRIWIKYLPQIRLTLRWLWKTA